MGLEFSTAVAAVNAEDGPDGDDVDEGLTFEHDGQTVRFYKPTTGQIAMAMSMTQDRAKDNIKVAGTIDFFLSLFDKSSQSYFQARLFDREDRFGIKGPGGINDILDSLIAEWSGRPTQRSTDSTSLQTETGPSSTPTPALSTSSDFGPSGS